MTQRLSESGALWFRLRVTSRLNRSASELWLTPCPVHDDNLCLLRDLCRLISATVPGR
jgi:hypothetical protein